MLDTLMVLWTKGMFTRFLRVFFSFFLLLAGLCLLLFVITGSNVKWAGLAFTASAPGPGSASASSSIPAVSLPTPVADNDQVPIIMHNPTPATKLISLAASSGAKHVVHKHHSVLTPTPHYAPVTPPQNRLQPEPAWTPASQPGENDWFPNAIAAHGSLQTSFAGSASQQMLENLFWPALLTALLMIGCCFVLLSLLHRKDEPRS